MSRNMEEMAEDKGYELQLSFIIISLSFQLPKNLRVEQTF